MGSTAATTVVQQQQHPLTIEFIELKSINQLIRSLLAKLTVAICHGPELTKPQLTKREVDKDKANPRAAAAPAAC